jgi:CheY-like chemotaxis protein
MAADHAILIVEDNDVNLMVLRSLLRKKGYEPLVAKDGLEGLEMALAYHPRLILMDLNMPRMDGFASAAEIRRQLPGHDIIIVAVTANVTDEQVRACNEAGFAGLLPKPLDFMELSATVRKWAGDPRPAA